MTYNSQGLPEEYLQLRNSLYQLEKKCKQDLRQMYQRMAKWEREWQTSQTSPAIDIPFKLPDDDKITLSRSARVTESVQAPLFTPINKTEIQAPIAPERKKEVSFPKTNKLSPLLEMLWYPFGHIKHSLGGIYTHYKQDGKLPVFFMTLGGILALLFGFGYLMQMGINILLDHLSERSFMVLKLGGSFLFSSAVIVWGGELIRKGEHLRDFGAAMLGLGIAINYLCLYVVCGSDLFPLLQHTVPGWGLSILNSALGVWLALRRETKIVAVVSLLGGAFAPFYLHLEGFTVFYFGYLWVLSASAVWLSQKIEWPPLRFGAFSIVVFMIEWIWFQRPESLSLLAFSVGIHAFVFLFIGSVIRQKGKWTQQFNKQHLFLLGASVGVGILTLFLLFKAHAAIPALGWVYLANASIIALGLTLFHRNFSQQLRWIALLLIGGLSTLAVPALLNQAWMGLAWAFEGLLLLIFGQKFNHQKVRIEALILLAIAAIRMAVYLPDIAVHWHESIWNEAFIQFICLGVTMSGIWGIYRYYPPANAKEQKFFELLSTLLSPWIATGLLLLACWYLALWGFLFASLLSIILILLGKQKNLFFSECSGFVYMLLLSIPYFISVTETLSLRLSLQSLPAQIGIILLGLQAFFLQYIYKTKRGRGRFSTLVIGLREGVWLIIPGLWLRPFSRMFPEHMATAFFVAIVFAMVLRHYLKRKERLFVKKGLSLTIIFYFTGLCLAALWPVDTIWGQSDLFGSTAYYYFCLPGIAFLIQAIYRQIYGGKAIIWWKLAGLWSALLVFHFIIYLSGLPALSFALTATGVYISVLLPYLLERSLKIRRSKELRVLGNILLLIGFLIYGIPGIANNHGVNLPMLSLMGILGWISHRGHFRPKKEDKPSLTFNIWFFHLILPVFYFGFQLFWQNDPGSFGPILTAMIIAHAMFLLFVSRQNGSSNFIRYALLLFLLGFGKMLLYDFSHFSLLSKVLVSMGIGGIMLLGSRLFLRLQTNG